MARSKPYPRDVRERAVALVVEQVKTGQYGSRWEAICSVAAKIGASVETVRKWVRQAGGRRRCSGGDEQRGIGRAAAARTQIRDHDGVIRDVERTGRSKAAEALLKEAIRDRGRASRDGEITGESTVRALGEVWLAEIDRSVKTRQAIAHDCRSVPPHPR